MYTLINKMYNFNNWFKHLKKCFLSCEEKKPLDDSFPITKEEVSLISSRFVVNLVMFSHVCESPAEWCQGRLWTVYESGGRRVDPNPVQPICQSTGWKHWTLKLSLMLRHQVGACVIGLSRRTLQGSLCHRCMDGWMWLVTRLEQPLPEHVMPLSCRHRDQRLLHGGNAQHRPGRRQRRPDVRQRGVGSVRRQRRTGRLVHAVWSARGRQLQPPQETEVQPDTPLMTQQSGFSYPGSDLRLQI